MVGELGELQALDEIDDGIQALFIYRYDGLSRGIMIVEGTSYAVARHLRNPCRCILSYQAE